MELRHLRYFVALADTLSFTRAAESLYVSQSTLSQQIAALERELGAQLFERDHRQVALTRAGAALLPEARELLDRAGALGRIAQGGREHGEQSPSLHIGFDARVLGSDFLRRSVYNSIFEMRGQLGQLHAGFMNAEYDAVLHALADGSLDLAFFLHQKPQVTGEGLLSRCLYEDEMVVATRTAQQLEDTPECLRRVLLTNGVTLLEGEGRGMLQAFRIFEALGIEPAIHFVSDREVMRLSLNCGERASLLPLGLLPRIAAPDVQTLALRVPEARIHVLAAWRERAAHPLVGRIVSAVEQAFAPWVEKRAAELGR